MKQAIQKLQITLAILKPHICKDPYSKQAILDYIRKDGFEFVRSSERELSKTEVESFYDEHRNKFFYNRLVTFMTSGPVSLNILLRDNAIQRWRDIMGPTKVFRTKIERPETLRGLYGLSDTRNATHGSDSPISAKNEIEFFFPDFDYDRFMTELNEKRSLEKDKICT